jgi:hypothetical protein
MCPEDGREILVLVAVQAEIIWRRATRTVASATSTRTREQGQVGLAARPVVPR